MSSSWRVSLFVLSALLLGATASSAQEDSSLLVTGNDSGVWLLRRNVSENTFDVVARPTGGQWEWIKKDLTGAPAAIAAVGRQLHVLLTPTGYLIFDPNSPAPTRSINPDNPENPRWPTGAPILAACEGGGLGETNQPGLLVIVPLAPKPQTKAAGILPAPRNWRPSGMR